MTDGVEPQPLRCVLADVAATERLGALLAAHLPRRGLVALEGPLGAGKTSLVRGLLRGLGYQGRVRSPSYSLLEVYELDRRSVVHLDLYRIADPEELEYLGLREYLDGEALLLVEWPQRGASVLPAPCLRIELDYHGDGRLALLQARSRQGIAVLKALRSSMADEQCGLTDGLHG